MTMKRTLIVGAIVAAGLTSAAQAQSLKVAVSQRGFWDSSFLEFAERQGFLKQAGSAAEGAKFFVNFTPLNESQPVVDLYKKWLQQVAPGAQPTFFGLFAWSAADLFATKAMELGGKLTRASLVQAVQGIDGWTDGGAHAPMSVGAKHPPVCVRWMTVQGGNFVSYTPKYVCGGYTKAS